MVENLSTQKVVGFLKHLGLEPLETETYLYLLQYGPQTVLSLSRGLATGRTKLYPLLEGLADKQLIAVHERHYGTSYEAQPPAVLDFLVTEHEQKAAALRADLAGTLHTLSGLQQLSPVTSRIAEYRGVDGLKQMNFNLVTNARDEYRVFELQHLDRHLGKHFAEKMRRRASENSTTGYDLTNDPHWKLDSDIPDYHKLSRAAYIDPEVFAIEFETYIYNNCVALLSYQQDDIFGIEIYNDKLSRQMRQLFEVLWKQARIIQ
jgi:sugar-specific transcriptional regulator TrmB